MILGCTAGGRTDVWLPNNVSFLTSKHIDDFDEIFSNLDMLCPVTKCRSSSNFTISFSPFHAIRGLSWMKGENFTNDTGKGSILDEDSLFNRHITDI